MCSSYTPPGGIPVPVCLCGKIAACAEPNPDCGSGACKCCTALGECGVCDPTTADTCGKGGCLCGTNEPCKAGYSCVSGTCKLIIIPTR